MGAAHLLPSLAGFDARDSATGLSKNAPTVAGLSCRVAIVSNTGTTTETRYLWCGERLCQARDASDTVIRRYYPEGELRPTDSTTPRRYYGRDHLGSIRDVLALPSGKNIGTADYTPYGKPTKTTGKAKTDFRYAGMFYLPEAGLYLTHYRVYDPTLGRWLSRDPIGEKGGVNLYAYVGNDPVNFVDPWGLIRFCEALRIIQRTPNSFTDGSDLYISEITKETDLLESLDIPLNVEGIDLQYFLLMYNMTASSDRITGAAAISAVTYYSLIGSGFTSYFNSLNFEYYLDDVASDARGNLLGYEAGLKGLGKFIEEKCDECSKDN